MGLAIEVGVLADLLQNDVEGAEWFKQEMRKINEVLAENDLPQHHEPESLPELLLRNALCGFPYSFLHHLRRFFVYATTNPGWEPAPTPTNIDPAADPKVEEETFMMSSHLLCHSDCEGFYLPIDFADIVIDDQGKNRRILGGILGSSYRLMIELVGIAPKLGIRLQDVALSDGEAERINGEVESQDGLWLEKAVWLSLFEAARLSIEFKTAIQFA